MKYLIVFCFTVWGLLMVQAKVLTVPSFENFISLQEDTPKDTVYLETNVDTPPEFPGGKSALGKYIINKTDSITYANNPGCQMIIGRILVSFVVRENGEISNVKIEKGIDKSLDKEAVKIIEEMPLWIPGKKDGKKVNTKTNAGVIFRLL